LTLSWSELLPAGGPAPVSYTAAYQIKAQGADWRLYRYYCDGSTLTESQIVADNLQGSSAGSLTITPAATPSTVTLTLTERSGFSYTVSGTQRV
jgi:hypothetical protein